MDLRKKLENASGADIEAIIDDLAALKKDVAKAIAQVKAIHQARRQRKDSRIDNQAKEPQRQKRQRESQKL